MSPPIDGVGVAADPVAPAEPFNIDDYLRGLVFAEVIDTHTRNLVYDNLRTLWRTLEVRPTVNLEAAVNALIAAKFPDLLKRSTLYDSLWAKCKVLEDGLDRETRKANAAENALEQANMDNHRLDCELARANGFIAALKGAERPGDEGPAWPPDRPQAGPTNLSNAEASVVSRALAGVRRRARPPSY